MEENILYTTVGGDNKKLSDNSKALENCTQIKLTVEQAKELERVLLSNISDLGHRCISVYRDTFSVNSLGGTWTYNICLSCGDFYENNRRHFLSEAGVKLFKKLKEEYIESNKYYTPTIEEFHHGFEYEVFEDWDTLKEKSWHKQIYDYNSANPERLEFVGGDMNKYRVKFLCTEDLEELGFLETTTGMIFEFTENDILTLEYFEEGKGWYLTYSENESQFSFAGWIKNKSELKKLMKQLNI